MVFRFETLEITDKLHDLSVAIEHQAMDVCRDASTGSEYALVRLMTEALESVTAAYEIYAHIMSTLPKLD